MSLPRNTWRKLKLNIGWRLFLAFSRTAAKLNGFLFRAILYSNYSDTDNKIKGGNFVAIYSTHFDLKEKLN
jgi:hypothetical protein